MIEIVYLRIRLRCFCFHGPLNITILRKVFPSDVFGSENVNRLAVATTEIWLKFTTAN